MEQKCSLKNKEVLFFYPIWDEKEIHLISDLYFGNNLVKTFEDLVIEFVIPITDRRKYNSLMNDIFLDWFGNPKNIQDNVFDKITSSLIGEAKVPKHVYSVLRDHTVVEVENKWMDLLNVLEEVEWDYIHKVNSTCTIETQLPSFYFKFIHSAYTTRILQPI